MSVTELRPHPAVADRLGRSIVNHDPRNRRFAALDHPAPPRQLRPGAAWYRRDVYDQQGPSCTAQSAVGVCRSGPFYMQWRRRVPSDPWPSYDTEVERHDLYRAAQLVDPWPGAEPDYEGSSTDAPFIVLRNRGQIDGWRWLFGEAELWEWVTNFGPASVGTTWTWDMFDPDPQGYIIPSGGSAGGHAWSVVQAQQERQAYRLVNSWGRGWGQNGRAWITRQNMDLLLRDQGEAVTLAS